MSDKRTALLLALEADLREELLPEEYSATVSSHPPIDVSGRVVACSLLHKNLVKKFCEDEGPSTSACMVAREKFLASQQRCLDWTPGDHFEWQAEVLGEMKLFIHKLWSDAIDSGFVSFRYIHELGYAGPGASIGVNRDTSFYTKVFDAPLSATSQSLLSVWKACIVGSERWANAEKHRSSLYKDRVVPGSRLSFVNKTSDAARAICTEPSVNMWFQLGLGRLISNQLKKFSGIDLSTQPDVNGSLAHRGSVDGSLATIDLQDASDSISTQLVRYLCPPSMTWWFEFLRSPVIQLPDKLCVRPSMISTMGNGFTFPLMTLIFTALVRSVYRQHSWKAVSRGRDANFGVFGDDIIVKTEVAARVLTMLKWLGFSPNASKTFLDGGFRESCGHDFYYGHNVRSVYIKALRTPQERAVAINRVVAWCSIQGIKLPKLCECLARGKKLLSVPGFSNEDAGVYRPLDRAGATGIGHGLYRFSFYEARVQTIRISKEDGQITIGRQAYQGNPNGLELCAIRGVIRGHRIGIRSRVPHYAVKRSVTASWNTVPRSCQSFSDWRRWSDAYYGCFPLP